MQELTDRLEVFAPVYVIFTKADLIAGFSEFFADADPRERDRVWGATLPYGADESRDVLTQFDERFDELYEGLKEMGTAQISLRRSGALPPGLLTFPPEFAAIKPALRTFLSTLFETNPFQYKPVFRGFYFTSALQEGASRSTSTEKLAERFSLRPSTRGAAPNTASHNGLFLRDLFSNVIFADKKLVRQHASPNKVRMRYLTFFGLVLALGLVLGGWSWSYLGNRQLATNVQADLDKVVRLQSERTDLQSRLEAMEILQDRIEQLDRYSSSRPLSLGLGLYQGDVLRERLLAEYYNGLRQFMLVPVKASLEEYLGRVDTSKAAASGATATPVSTQASAQAPGQPARANAGDTLFQDASPTNVDDAYNALKTYLMMANREHVDPTHLSDQITRFWRGWLETNRGAMPRDQLIRSAERLISFYVARAADADWPQIETNLALVERTRGNLRSVMQGMPARERAYSTLKARAATRFPAMTVARIMGEADAAVVAGSYAVPGTFTREAWEQYIEPAIGEAARREVQTSDWVLGVNARDDLTLEGSPEQIQKSLATMYKTEYAQEWQKMLRGVTIKPFNSFEQAVHGMNRLGDPQNSPLVKLINTTYEQTSWDNPSLINTGISQAQTGVVAWFKRVILRQGQPKPAQAQTAANGEQIPMGPVGREFSDVARLVVTRDNQSLMGNYMTALSKIRTRFNLINNQGDPGPGALLLMRQTLEGKDSELADALKLVDEQMLAARATRDAAPAAGAPADPGLCRGHATGPDRAEQGVERAGLSALHPGPGRQVSVLDQGRHRGQRRRNRPGVRPARQHRQVRERHAGAADRAARRHPDGAHLGRHGHRFAALVHCQLCTVGGPAGGRGGRLGRGVAAADAVPDPTQAGGRRHGIHHRDRRPATALSQHAAAVGQLRVAQCAGRTGRAHHGHRV